MPDPETPSRDQNLVFLKLGGSLITDKSQPRTPRRDILARLAGEIASARERNPNLRLLLGHGSGSFGHRSGDKFGTRDGVASKVEWEGFSQVWHDAATLNAMVMAALHREGLPAIAFPPSASGLLSGREVSRWCHEPLRRALSHDLLPVVYGDVLFDDQIGGTIYSTEEVFATLAREIRPKHILLAGREPGVWQEYPQKSDLLSEITPETYPRLAHGFHASGETDVTGGMIGKVDEMVTLVKDLPGLEIWIFSGREEGAVFEALLGEVHGTHIHR